MAKYGQGCLEGKDLLRGLSASDESLGIVLQMSPPPLCVCFPFLDTSEHVKFWLQREKGQGGREWLHVLTVGSMKSVLESTDCLCM